MILDQDRKNIVDISTVTALSLTHWGNEIRYRGSCAESFYAGNPGASWDSPPNPSPVERPGPGRVNGIPAKDRGEYV